MQIITEDNWPLLQDSDGRILDEYSVRKRTFYKGVAPEIRPEVWTFLLGYYHFTSTSEERKGIDTDRRESYEALVKKWSAPDFVPSRTFSQYERVIEKDVWRTDRHLEFYSDRGGNIETLQRILKSYVLYNPDMGYIQGMNDILSPLLIVLQSEHQAFWCLVEALARMHSVLSDLTLSQPLNGLSRLCWYMDKQLYDHIESVYDGDDWLFCYRWILLQFKREFTTDEAFNIFECIWSNHATEHFLLFFAMAVLLYLKTSLTQCLTVEAFMEVTDKATGQLPLTPILTGARSLLEGLKNDEYCPHELRYLISGSGRAPPPLVGFVRVRQRLSTLHSNTSAIQRNQIWRSLFGESPQIPITSPLRPLTNQDTCNGSRDGGSLAQHPGTNSTDENVADSSRPFPSSFSPIDPNGTLFTENHAPPTDGFIPRRNSDLKLVFREDIRKTRHNSITGHIELPGQAEELVTEVTSQPSPNSGTSGPSSEVSSQAGLVTENTKLAQQVFPNSYRYLINRDRVLFHTSMAMDCNGPFWCRHGEELETFDYLRAEADLIGP